MLKQNLHGDAVETFDLALCVKECFKNQSLIDSGVQISAIPGQIWMSNKKLLDRQIKQYQDARSEMEPVIPKTYELPQDAAQLQEDYDRENKFYIYKPAGSSRGRGIALIPNVTEFLANESSPTGIV